MADSWPTANPVSLNHLPADLRSPQDLAPLEQLSLTPGCPGVFGPVPQPVSMEAQLVHSGRYAVNRARRGVPSGEDVFETVEAATVVRLTKLDVQGWLDGAPQEVDQSRTDQAGDEVDDRELTGRGRAKRA